MPILLVAIVAGCVTTGPGLEGGGVVGPPGDLVHPERPAETEDALVTRIIDGDSIDIETSQGVVEVRLLGVNAPETGECFADESREFLIDKAQGERAGVEIEEADQFGRSLGAVWIDEEMINLTLVANGLATALTPGDDDRYGSQLIAAEQDAFEQGIGMWAVDACGPGMPLPDVSIDLGDSSTNPPGPDDERLEEEYIVILNGGDQSHDLGGWILRDESSRNRLTFPEGLELSAGERLRVSSGCDTTPSWCGQTPIWNNSGDMVLLVDQSGRVVARARY